MKKNMAIRYELINETTKYLQTLLKSSCFDACIKPSISKIPSIETRLYNKSMLESRNIYA